MGKLIDGPTFALPFWNWDSPAGMQMPAMYTNTKSSLYDQLRDRNRYPPALVDYNGTEETTTDKDQTTSNLRVMNRQMISNGKTTKVFLGSPYRTGDEPDPGAGSLEDIPHGTIHNWCGDNTQPNLEDIGNFYSGEETRFAAFITRI